MPGSLDHRRRRSSSGPRPASSRWTRSCSPWSSRRCRSSPTAYGFATTVAALIFAPSRWASSSRRSAAGLRGARRPAARHDHRRRPPGGRHPGLRPLGGRRHAGAGPPGAGRSPPGLVWTAGLAAISASTPVRAARLPHGPGRDGRGGIGLIGPLVGGALIDTVAPTPPSPWARSCRRSPSSRRSPMPETRRHSFRRAAAPGARAAAAGGGPHARVAFWSLASRGRRARAGGAAAAAQPGPPPRPVVPRHRAGVLRRARWPTSPLVPLAGCGVRQARPPAPLLAGGALMAGGLPLMAVGPPVVRGAGVRGRGGGHGVHGRTRAAPLLVEAVDEAGMAGATASARR